MRRLTGCLLMVAICGCVTVESPPPPSPPPDATVITQEGTVTTFNLEERTVYYPAPFLSPPSLEVTPVDEKGVIVRLGQRNDRFFVSAAPTAPGQMGVTLKWKARGSVPKSLATGVSEPSTSSFATSEDAR